MPEKPAPAEKPPPAPPDIAQPAETPAPAPAQPAEAPKEPAAVSEAGSTERLLGEILAAARTGDVLARERVQRTLVARGREALPLIFAELAKPAFPAVLIDILEEVTQQDFGLDPAAWRAWWEQRAGWRATGDDPPAPTAR